jgi:hypothetical protein
VKRSAIGLGLALAALGCNRIPASRSGTGQVDIHWEGSERGRLSGTATAEWCSILRLLEIRGLQGDTGFAMALYPTDSATSGEYRVVDPTKGDSLRPAVGIALRWVTQTAIKGFQGESGSVALQRGPSGELSGRVTAGARSATDTQRITIEGSFKDLTIRSQARGCAPRREQPDTDAEPIDTQLH